MHPAIQTTLEDLGRGQIQGQPQWTMAGTMQHPVPRPWHNARYGSVGPGDLFSYADTGLAIPVKDWVIERDLIREGDDVIGKHDLECPISVGFDRVSAPQKKMSRLLLKPGDPYFSAKNGGEYERWN